MTDEERARLRAISGAATELVALAYEIAEPADLEAAWTPLPPVKD